MLKETPLPLFWISKSSWGGANKQTESSGILAKAVGQEKKKKRNMLILERKIKNVMICLNQFIWHFKKGRIILIRTDQGLSGVGDGRRHWLERCSTKDSFGIVLMVVMQIYICVETQNRTPKKEKIQFLCMLFSKIKEKDYSYMNQHLSISVLSEKQIHILLFKFSVFEKHVFKK